MIFKKSIVSKIFIMNLIILIVIVIAQLGFQFFYFEDYYVFKKRTLMEERVKELTILLNEDKDNNTIKDYIIKVARDDNIGLSIRDKNFNNDIYLDNYMLNSHIAVLDNNSQKYKVILEGYSKELEIKPGDDIKVSGFNMENSYVIPNSILVNGVEYDKGYEIIPIEAIGFIGSTLNEKAYSNSSETLNSAMEIVIPEANYIKVEGVAEELIIGNTDYEYLNSILANLSIYDKDTYNKVINKDTYNKVIESDHNRYKNLIYSKHLDNYIISSITELSKVSEVLDVMNGFYIILFLLCLILVTVVSIVYSKFITKPLIIMNNVANDIANCEFKTRYEVCGEDEIGQLGTSLNRISENLQKSLLGLKQSNEKLLEDINIKIIEEEKRKELVANISHELKTPITIIQGYINGSIHEVCNIEDHYKDILEETKRMDELVKEFLQISKLESPEFKLKNEPFDLCGTFLKVNDKIRRLLNEKMLKLELALEADEAVVLGDEKRIEQVITNLYTNGIKYSPSGETIKVKIENYSEDSYCFSIENTGVSLTEDELSKVWESFYRSEKSRNKKYGGTGLGLTIVKIILKLHKSNFGVESNIKGENKSGTDDNFTAESKRDTVKFYFTLEKFNYEE